MAVAGSYFLTGDIVLINMESLFLDFPELRREVRRQAFFAPRL